MNTTYYAVNIYKNDYHQTNKTKYFFLQEDIDTSPSRDRLGTFQSSTFNVVHLGKDYSTTTSTINHHKNKLIKTKNC